jgi:hypothetical protein
MHPASLRNTGHVHQVPRHQGGIAVGEVVIRAAGPRVQVGRARPGFTDPAGVSLQRDGVPEVLQAVEHIHRAVLDSVLIASDQAAANAAVVRVLARLVEQVQAGIEALDHLLGH